jgi:hypothetical protein
MKAKTIYIADDGKEFNNEQDCLNYEREKKCELLYNKENVLFYNSHGEPSQFHLDLDPDEIFYIDVSSIEAAEAVKEWFDEWEDADSPFNVFAPSQGYFYYDGSEGWKDLELECRAMKFILNVFGISPEDLGV